MQTLATITSSLPERQDIHMRDIAPARAGDASAEMAYMGADGVSRTVYVHGVSRNVLTAIEDLLTDRFVGTQQELNRIIRTAA